MNLEAMKAQTIGVEVEMNRITRQNASKVAAEFFGTNRYQDTHIRNGYQTWSAWDTQGREWKFCSDCSIRGPADCQTELVTPILHYEDIELLQDLVRALRKAGARSDYKRGCGVHIHIGAQGHTPRSLLNLTNIMASHEELLVDALGLDRNDPRRYGHYCKPVDHRFLTEVNQKKPTTMSALADVWYTSQRCDRGRDMHYNESRYHMLNLHAVFTKGTIEFRLFQFDAPDRAAGKRGGLHAGALKAFIQLCLAMSQMAKDARTASWKPQQVENPKYAMRTWLLRLGFIGDEFATARDLLTRRLSGDAAFRHGRNAA